MNKKISDKLKYHSVLLLFGIIFLSCASLIFINYSTIRILSANRAYVNGESQYSKAQKDGVRYLTAYLDNKDEKYWGFYLREMDVLKGSKLAVTELSKNPDGELAKIGLRGVRCKEGDIDDMVWLFKNFKNVSFFAEAIDIWLDANTLYDELVVFGNRVREKVISKNLTQDEKKVLLLKLESKSEKFTVLERNFSDALGNGSREMKSILIFANIFFILIIISCVGIYFSVMMKKLLESANEIKLKNDNLILVNKELDSFVYSASHDLRSPLTSLKGLVEIARTETDAEVVKVYFDLMDQSITKQDQFISDIIDHSRNKRKEKTIELVSLHQIIDDVLKQHVTTKKNFKVVKKLEIDEIYSDNLRMKIIFNNLISNVFKYYDPEKPEHILEIKFSRKGAFYKIVVKDNGIGINEAILPRVFEMFFGTNNNLGSGLGLYITKEAVEILNGTINVSSQPNKGTTFTILLPNRHET